MTEYDNTNRGSIWRNEKKENDKHPDFTGSLNVDGKDYWVSAWKRKEGASDRSPALSFSVKRKDGKPTQSGSERTQSGNARPSLKDDMDGEEIPF